MQKMYNVKNVQCGKCKIVGNVQGIKCTMQNMYNVENVQCRKCTMQEMKNEYD